MRFVTFNNRKNFAEERKNLIAKLNRSRRRLAELYNEYKIPFYVRLDPAKLSSSDISKEIKRLPNSRSLNYRIYKYLYNTNKNNLNLNKINFIGSTNQDFKDQINYINEHKDIGNEILKFVNQQILQLTTDKSNLALLLSKLNNLNLNNKYVILTYTLNDVEHYYTLSNANRNKEMLQFLNNSYISEPVEKSGSDLDFEENFEVIGDEINLNWEDHEQNINNGAYFPYYNNSEFKLKKYQIYKQDEKINNENCFIYALQQHKIDENKLLQIKLMLNSNNVSFTAIRQIAEKLDLCIEIKHYKVSEDQTRTITYNSESKNKVYLGLIENHYFINEKTNISHNAIYFYDQTKNHKHFPHVKFCKNNGIKNHKITLNSYDVIKNMLNFKSKFFIPITAENVSKDNINNDLLEYTKLRDINDDEFKTVESSYNDKHLFKCFKPEDYAYWNKYDTIYADFETYYDVDEKMHKPYSISFKINNKPIENFYGLDCVELFLKKIKRNSLVYFHNLGFDFRMIYNYLDQIDDYIANGNKIKCVTGKYNKIWIKFKDTYAFLNYKLSQFPKMFNLDDIQKEVYPYTLITKENYDQLIPLDECLLHLKEEDHKQFKMNIKVLNCLNNNLVNIKKYTKYYNDIDVDVLYQGFTKFKQQCKEITGMNIDYLVSLSQMAHEYLVRSGCYDGCYKISGQAQHFIRQAVVGGRTMTKCNKSYHTNKQLQDLDAVSLYPSAVVELDGFVKGKPKVFSDFEDEEFETEFNDWRKSYDMYYVKIRVTAIKKKLKFPLLSIIKKDGVREFTNDIIGKEFVVNKITLQDCIKYHGIKFKILMGYYFNEGFNPTVKEIVRDLYNKRNEFKKQKNPIQATYKLILNSFYGKTIQKSIEYEHKFINGRDKFISYIGNQHYKLKDSIKLSNDWYLVKTEKQLINQFSLVHIGVDILSMSKRIMNRVMTTAQDNKIDIYYQDTDSMHIINDKIDLLAEAYKKKYNRELIGSDLGQFHSDFDFPGTNIRSVESYFLGKKSYIDKIKYTNSNNKEVKDYHIRLKGIPSACITHKVKTEYKNKPMNLFKDLFNGKKIDFDLSIACKLQFNNNFSINNIKDFTRTIHFNNAEIIEEDKIVEG